MNSLLRWFCLTLCCAGALPAFAQMLPGANDPAYIAAMERALASDDPAVLAELHRLASAGNSAALVALPSVSGWIPATGSLADKNRLRMIGSEKVTDLGVKVSPAMAAWRAGEVTDDMAVMFASAELLIALGEPEKGADLFTRWVNQTGAFGPLPDGFADLRATPRDLALAMTSRMGMQAESREDDIAIVMDWVAEGRIEGAMVLAEFTAFGGRLRQEAGNVLGEALALRPDISAEELGRKIAVGALVLEAYRLHDGEQAPQPTSVAAARDALAAQDALGSIAQYCAARCAATAEACETSYLTAFGLPFDVAAYLRPMSDALSREDFFASARGEQFALLPALMQSMRYDPDSEGDAARITALPAMRAAIALDACFGEGVGRVLAGPLPGAD